MAELTVSFNAPETGPVWDPIDFSTDITYNDSWSKFFSKEEDNEDELEDDNEDEFEDDNGPFDTLKPIIEELIQRICSGMLCSVTDIGRGSFNRVIGVDLFDPTPSGTTVSSIVRPWFIRSSKLPAGRYVLRIPIKQWQSWPEHEIAIHRYIEAYTAIPAPRFAFSDLTDQNEIGSVYMIQSRVPGNNIVNSFKELNFDQTMSLASQVGQAFGEFSKLSYDAPGNLSPLSLLNQANIACRGISGVSNEALNHDPTSAFPGIVKFAIPNRISFDNLQIGMVGGRHNHSTPSTPQTPLQLIQELAERQMQLDHACGRLGYIDWGRLGQIGAHMHDLGLFHDSEHYLAHLDLEPRNMMYEVVDEKTVKLTGFIDWDSAVFAPRFMHCKTPQWLWAWDRLTVEHERDALDEPYVYESIAIKKAFDEAAGASFCHYAYSHDYRVARRLFQLAINPAMVTRAKQEAYLLMYRWNMLHPDHEVYMTEMEIRSARFSDLAEV